MPKKSLLFLMGLITGWLFGISVSGNNLLLINGIGFTSSLEAERRSGSSSQEPVAFSTSSESFADSLAILYSAPEMELRLSFTKMQDLGPGVWQSTARAVFNTELKLRKLNLVFSFENQPSISFYSGSAAVQKADPALNKNITPFSDKIVAYANSGQKFWIVASNYRGCEGVEGLPINQVSLYDYSLHHFKRYQQGANQTYTPMDCMPRQAGDHYQWSWLWFESEPVILKLKRWPGDREAALGITSDPDSETADKILAVYMGSNNPTSQKYGSQGFIPHGIPVSNGIFGADESNLSDQFNLLYQSGNSIAYHTYTDLEDPQGSNSQALLHDLLKYYIRMWTDHNIPLNPECLGFNGLDPGSLNFVGDIINQSNICYAWMNDNAANNPFNSFDDPWRLPHLLYEMSALSKPVWFFGRTKALTWEYLNGNVMLDMKHVLTSENLDQLLLDGGLHISYTNLFLNNAADRNSFYVTSPNGDYEIRPEVEEMLQMLVHYREEHQLWIDTPENIFDRLLATEEVEIESVVPILDEHCSRVILKNKSERTLDDFKFSHNDYSVVIPAFTSKGTCEFLVNTSSLQVPAAQQSFYKLAYKDNNLFLTKSGGEVVDFRRLTIYNLKGQKVFSLDQQIPDEVVDIPFQGFATGVYFATIEAHDRSIQKAKFIVLK